MARKGGICLGKCTFCVMARLCPPSRLITLLRFCFLWCPSQSIARYLARLTRFDPALVRTVMPPTLDDTP